jgi:hypothetical protein
MEFNQQMSAGQTTFSYSAAQLKQLELILSKERLSSYAKATPEETIKNYERNTILSEAVYGLLQGVEIAVRNSIHNALSMGLFHSDWYGYISWQKPELDALDQARYKLVRRGKALVPGSVIAELPFGFWLQMVARRYEKVLWVPYVHKAFPNIVTDRNGLFRRLDEIRELRNRIAHHERILHFNLPLEYTQAIEVIRWICPITAAWVDATNRVKANLP